MCLMPEGGSVTRANAGASVLTSGFADKTGGY
jgi:hypothetical protein